MTPTHPLTPNPSQRLPLAAALLLLAAMNAAAQTASSAPPDAQAPATTGAATPKAEQAVQLNPFEVSADKNSGYGALESNSLSAFKMDLQKMPASAQIFSDTFIQDTNSTSIEDLMINYAGVVGYAPGDSSAYTESAGDRDGGGGLSVRGFGGTPIKFDGFFGPPSDRRSASGHTPTFMVDRVELIEGPQSLLYGAIGAGGVINAIYKEAQFGTTRGSVNYTVDGFGSKQGTVDYNWGNDHVAVRFAAENESDATERQDLGAEQKGFYVQAAAQLGKGTTIRLIHNKYETQSWNGFTPNYKSYVPAAVGNDSAGYLLAEGLVPDSALGGHVDWFNGYSFAGSWGVEPSTITNNSLEVESTPLSWLSIKATAIYNQYVDWRDTTSMTLVAPGVSGNPTGTNAIEMNNPNLNFQSQRQKAIQLNFLATNEFFHGFAKSQTLLDGYLNHIGPSFGSSGITYSYVQADSNWNPVIGTATSNYGHILMPAQWVPIVNGQITRYPLFHPGDPRVTVAGVNYILIPEIEQSAAYKGLALPGDATNPYGLVPNGSNNLNNPSANSSNYNFTGTFNPGTEEHEHFLAMANYTDWWDGRFSTLGGVSLDRAISQNTGATNPGITIVPWKTYVGYELGLIYQVTPWLGAYGTLSTAATPAGSTNDIYGDPLQTPDAKSPVPELGLKLHNKDNSYTAQLAWDIQTKDKNEIQSVDSSYQNAANPAGINGRLGAPVGSASETNNFVNIDRTATALEFTATAQPTSEWRLRMNVSYLFARVLDSVTYKQVYNDQFKTDASGNVTFQNGSIIYVNGNATSAAAANIVAPGTAGAVPLTVNLINNAASPYYAAPDPTSGSITNTALRTILTNGGAANSVGATEVNSFGQSATGAVGLPLTAMQYQWTSPFGTSGVPVFRPGDPTTGYPGWQWNLVSNYEFDHGWAKGLSLFASASAQYSTRAYYTAFPTTALGATAGALVVNESRVIVVLPTVSNVGLGVGYTWKLWRETVRSRFNVSDLFNHDPFYVVPTAANGTLLNATQRIPRRSFTFSSGIDF